MGNAYKAVGWNAEKRRYDVVLGLLILAGFALFAVVSVLTRPGVTPETMIIRFTAIAAFVLLHGILAIGPLARLDPRFLPLLYNRRHAGVMMFLLALGHAAFAVFQFHGQGDQNPIVSALTAYQRDYFSGQVAHFPFEVFGAAALAILFLMAVTSHDFWLKNLGPSIWKTLHVGVYIAYLLLVAHVCFGILQSDRNLVFPSLLALGFLGLAALHILAAAKAWHQRARHGDAVKDGFLPVAPASALEEGRGKVVSFAGGSAALFLHRGRLFAVSNVCRHQGGPLGEGRIVADCITCPWHGYQYRPEDGCSPPPFEEILPTYRLRLVEDTIYLLPEALPPSTRSEGLPVTSQAEPPGRPFYIGWQSSPARMFVQSKRLAWGAAGFGFLAVLFCAALFQNPFDSGVFEFGTRRHFEGVLRAHPIPHLLSMSPTGAQGPVILLCGEGKFGPPPEVLEEYDGRHIAFQGTVIAREGVVMVQMDDPASLTAKGDGPRIEESFADLGPVTLDGELVDTKCFFGVMRPATGKVHRGCAVRCLSGGVPPGLLVRDSLGNGTVVLLAGPVGHPMSYDVEWAARTVRATGRLEMQRGIPILRTESLSLLP